MKKSIKKIISVALGIILIGAFSFSQIRESGSIQGTVADTEGVPLPGATVAVESPNLIGGVRSLVTDAIGFYKFSSLTVGGYKVTVELSGFNTMVREGIRLNAGVTLTSDFKMIQTTVQEEITVLADVPTVDVKSSQTGTVVLTTELITALPGKPSFEGLFNMAPGTDFFTSYGSGYASPNTYQLDGVDVSNPLWGGINFSIDTNTIQEATFQGLGAPAEFGQFTGAMLTAVTKSGSNKFSGMAEYKYRRQGWNSQNLGSIPDEKFYNPATKDSKYEIGSFNEVYGNVGGKIIQDKLWFFASGKRFWREERPIGTSGVRKFWTPNIFSKLTFQLNSSNKVNVSFNYFDDRGENILAAATWPEDLYLNNYMAGYFGNISWTSIFSNTTFLDAKVGYNWKQSSQKPPDTSIPGHRDLFLGTYSENYTNWSDSNYRTWHISAHLSHYVPEFIKGSHDIKIGAEIERFRILNRYGYNGGMYFTDFNGEPYLKTVSEGANFNHYFGPTNGFIQDVWTVSKRLTLNLGLRIEHWYYNIPSELAGKVYSNGAIAPRIGFTYDLFGDRKNVIKLFYGHLYENINRNMFNALETRSTGTAQYMWTGTDWALDYEILPGETASTTTVDPDVKHPYIWEISGGYERELFRDASFSINFYWKQLGAALGPVNMTSQYEKYTIINPGHDGIEGTADDMGTLDYYLRTTPYSDVRLLLTNPKAGMSPSILATPWKKMRGIEFIFNKKFSNRWQLIASYHYTKCTGNTEGVQSYIGYDPNQLLNASGEMVYYYGQPHQFKIQGTILLPLDINLGFQGHYMSGHPNQDYFYAYVGPQYSFIRGSPWGAEKCAANKDLSIRLQKIFRIKGVQLIAMADAFNVLNFHSTPFAWNYFRQFGPKYMTITSVQEPRNFQIGARIIF